MFWILETLISFILGVIEFFLGFRFLFKLFGASTAAPFVNWLYATTEPLLNPFRGIFPAPQIEGGYVIEFTTLVALLVYLFIGYLLFRLIAVMKNATVRDHDDRV